MAVRFPIYKLQLSMKTYLFVTLWVVLACLTVVKCVEIVNRPQPISPAVQELLELGSG